MAWRRPSEEEQRRRALPVLEAARALYLQGVPLTAAIQNAAQEPILSVYAMRAVEGVVCEPVPCFERRSGLTRRSVLQVLDRAASRCRAATHRGGWQVSR